MVGKRGLDMRDNKYHDIKQAIKEKQHKHHYDGIVSIYGNQQLVFAEPSGYKHLEHGIFHQAGDAFNISKHHDLFVTTTLMILLEQLNIDLETTIEQIMPELKYAHKIKYIHLLRTTSGLPDYHGEVLARLNKVKEDASDLEKKTHAINLATKYVDYQTALDFYNTNELLYEPGTESDFGDVLSIVGVELIERLSNKPYWDTVEELIFKPLHITYKNNSVNDRRYINEYYNKKTTIILDTLVNQIALKSQDIYTIFNGIKQSVICSSAVYKKMREIVKFNGINFGESYGKAEHFSAGPFSIIDFKKQDVQIVFSTTYSGDIIYEQDDFKRFISQVISSVESALLILKNPKLVKLNKRNVYDLLSLSNSPEKMWFMGSTKYMLAYQYVEKCATTYMCMDQGIYVGTVTLYIDKKGQSFTITNVLVDKRFQNRGYGKAMIRLSLDILKRFGASTITLWVDRANVTAYKAYASVGFKIKGTYPSSYEMVFSL